MADRINIEIEFKCLIDKAKYDALIKNFNISVKDLFELYDDFINNDKIKLEVYQKFKKWLF